MAEVPDLAGKIVDHVNVTGGRDGDGYGHGTFLAGLIAGSGAGLGRCVPGRGTGREDSRRPGGHQGRQHVAGEGASAACRRSQHSGSDRVPVVNLALSSGSPLPYQIDPLTNALDIMWMHGFTVVVPVRQ